MCKSTDDALFNRRNVSIIMINDKNDCSVKNDRMIKNQHPLFCRPLGRVCIINLKTIIASRSENDFPCIPSAIFPTTIFDFSERF